MDCGNKIADVFYAAGGRVNVIVPVLLQPAEPLHSFDCLCLKLKLVSCALACCIGTTTTADSIATAASIATITNVELFICLLLGTCTYGIFTLRKIILNFPYIYKYDNDIKK
jgi:hypothetical protein